MEDARRWSVTYTKHVKQKRKVYQDGYLEHQLSRHKVLLYDECDKLLESRFVKQVDVIKSGETLTSDSYLVDIGELCGGHKPTPALNSQEKIGKVSEKSGSLPSYSSQCSSTPFDRKPVFGKTKGRPINISPSAKLIRDFKKSESNKCVSSPNCMGMTKTSTTEWQVLYTTQITKKAKTFHDGFLELVVRGSQGRQVKLYDTNKRHLGSKFLKKDEIVCSGESITFEGHLVEIGEQEGHHKSVTDSTQLGKKCEVLEKADMVKQPAIIPTNKNFLPKYHGKTPENTSPGNFTVLSESSLKVEDGKLSLRNPGHEPKRAVHDILSILRQPILRKVVTMNKPLMDDCFELHSFDVHSDINDQIKECVEDCSGRSHEEWREKAPDHDVGSDVLKPELVQVLVAAAKCTSSENERKLQGKASISCPGLETANYTLLIPKVECTNHDKLMPSPFSVDIHTPTTAVLNTESQKTIKSATFTRSNENGEAENIPEIHACEEIVAEINAAATLSSSGTFPKLGGDKRSSSTGSPEALSSVGAVSSNDRKFHYDLWMDMDDFPSFDLGI